MSLVAAEDHTRARIYSDGVVPGAEATPELVESYLQRNEFFWLDITRPASATGSRMLDELGLDADTRRFLVGFPRRASVLRSRDHAWIVLHAAVGESGSAEIHAVTSRNFLITTRQDACPPLDALFDSWSEDFLPRHEPTAVVSQALYRLTDTVVTSFTSVLEYIDDEIDDLQSEIVTSPSNEHLQRLFGMQRNIVEMRRVVVPQRDMFGRLAAEVIRLPHEDESTALLFRVTYDQFIRLSDLLDSYRDPLERRTRHAPVHGVQPVGPGDDSADGHRHHLPAPHVHHRVFRAELRLHAGSHPVPLGLPRARDRDGAARAGLLVLSLPPARMDRSSKQESRAPVLTRRRVAGLG